MGSNSRTGSVNDTVLAKWDGEKWTHIKGPNSTISALEVYHDTLIVGGYFEKAMDLTVNNIAMYYPTEINDTDTVVNKIGDRFLGQNIPNPFKHTTSIPYYIPENSKGKLIILDNKGSLIKEFLLLPGRDMLELYLEEFCPGIYYYKLIIDDGKIEEFKKMVVSE